MTTPEARPAVKRARGSGRPRWAGLLVRPVLIALALLALWLWVQGQELDSIEARNLNREVIGSQLLEHIQLTLICTALTVAIAIPLGIAVSLSRSRAGRVIVLGLGNLGQAIPSIGLVVLLALVISVGVGTAVIALVVYAVLPVLRNTMVGIEGVDPTLTEAARGMGLSRLAVLFTVELPMAVPVILARHRPDHLLRDRPRRAGHLRCWCLVRLQVLPTTPETVVNCYQADRPRPRFARLPVSRSPA